MLEITDKYPSLALDSWKRAALRHPDSWNEISQRLLFLVSRKHETVAHILSDFFSCVFSHGFGQLQFPQFLYCKALHPLWGHLEVAPLHTRRYCCTYSTKHIARKLSDLLLKIGHVKSFSGLSFMGSTLCLIFVQRCTQVLLVLVASLTFIRMLWYVLLDFDGVCICFHAIMPSNRQLEILFPIPDNLLTSLLVSCQMHSIALVYIEISGLCSMSIDL